MFHIQINLPEWERVQNLHTRFGGCFRRARMTGLKDESLYNRAGCLISCALALLPRTGVNGRYQRRSERTAATQPPRLTCLITLVLLKGHDS